ncbi:MAG: hypothetical protein ACLFVU_13255 [Phycisphaerae bacterium]
MNAFADLPHPGTLGLIGLAALAGLIGMTLAIQKRKPKASFLLGALALVNGLIVLPLALLIRALDLSETGAFWNAIGLAAVPAALGVATLVLIALKR